MPQQLETPGGGTMSGLAVQLISTFDCSPMETPLRDSSAEAGFATIVRITQPQQLSQYMLAPSGDSEDLIGTIVVVRLEDWLRGLVESEPGQLSDASARQELRKHLDEFLSHLAVLTLRGRPVWLLTCPSNGWIADHYKLATLCRTMSNLFAARVRNLAQVAVLNWPTILSSDDIYDRGADKSRHIPFTTTAFERIGASIATQVATQIATSDASTVTTASTGSAELAAFLSRLLVNVTVAPTSDSDRLHVERILRTAASFSLAGESPAASEAEIGHVMGLEHCYLVSVADRLSDYGVTGVVAGRTAGDSLVVEALSLSCTVLGKQVEHALLSALDQIASAHRLNRVVFEYRPSGRNQPTLAFLKSLANEDADHRFLLSVGEINARIQQAAIAPHEWTVKVLVPQPGSKTS